jgi:hypothetical protein
MLYWNHKSELNGNVEKLIWKTDYKKNGFAYKITDVPHPKILGKEINARGYRPTKLAPGKRYCK